MPIMVFRLRSSAVPALRFALAMAAAAMARASACLSRDSAVMALRVIWSRFVWYALVYRVSGGISAPLVPLVEVGELCQTAGGDVRG